MTDTATKADYVPEDSADDTLVVVTDRLNAVMADETALLEAFNLREAGGLLDSKRAAVLALQRLLAKGTDLAGLPEEERDQAQASLGRLRDLADANRAAIERGLAAQMQLIQAIAQAVPKARADQSPVYKPDGRNSPPRPPEAYAFLSRM